MSRDFVVAFSSAEVNACDAEVKTWTRSDTTALSLMYAVQRFCEVESTMKVNSGQIMNRNVSIPK